jgi:putative oxidoreductase
MLSLKFLGKLSPFGFLVMRVGLGFVFIVHGTPKVFGGPALWAGLGAAMANLGVTMYPALWGFAASFTEFAGGILFVLGFMFRPASLMLAFVMAVATTNHIHNGDPFKVYAHALSLGVVFFGLALIGPGKLSIDGD